MENENTKRESLVDEAINKETSDLSMSADSKSKVCLGEKSWGDYGYEYDCGYDTSITCDDCKYGGGRKDPAAKCNQI